MAVERFPVEFGHILMFARAIGDPNPIYYDPDKALAPPTFVQASAQFDPDYGLRPKQGQPWMGSGKEPTQVKRDPSAGGGGGGGLHAEQHYTYHRIPKPGDVLTATSRTGEQWEREGRRGGKLLFSENFTEYRDQSGELVVTARSVGVRTERVVEQS
jgi:hypothetical protein